VLAGTIPTEYNGSEIKLSFENKSILSLKSTVKKGSFVLTGNILQPFESVYLSVNENGKYIGGCSFFIQARKMKISLPIRENKVLANEIKYENIPFTREQKQYEDLIDPVEDSLSISFNLLKKNNYGYFNGNLDSLTFVVRTLKNERFKKKINFVRSCHNYFGLYVFYKEILNNIDGFDIHPDSLMNIYTSFESNIKNTKLSKKVVSAINKRRSLLLGNLMPDFAIKTNTKQHYKLSNFRGKKCVLLCFWDSWCGPCIKNIPLLKTLEKEYEPKGLQIISVSTDNDSLKWFNSLKRYDMPWLQTCDLPGFIKNIHIADLYNINYIPQYFLLSKDGKLIYHNTQSSDTDDYLVLQQTLAKVLK
jgi:peroxiredoxin